MNLTDKERDRTAAIISEGVKKSTEILNLFSHEGMEGMMVFLSAMEALRLRYPGIFNMADRSIAVKMIAQWVAAGEPESGGNVPDLLLKKFGPEIFHEIEKEYAPEGEQQ